MSRSKYWQYLLNEEGQPVPYATILVKNAGSSTASTVYETESVGSSIPSGSILTDANGYFSFWGDPNDYPDGMNFDIAWSKPGSITAGGVNSVYLPMTYRQVDETDNDTTKDKLVSNDMARLWEARPQIYRTLNISGAELISPSAGLIDGNYNRYHNIDHPLSTEYPLVTVYLSGGRAIDNIPEYIDDNTVRVWIKSSLVSGSALYNFILVG